MASETPASSSENKDAVVPIVQFACPSCEDEFICRLDEEVTGEVPVCPGCRLTFTGSAMALSKDRPIDECYICGNREFYVQKDFNRQLGFLIVVTSALVVFIVMALWGHLVGIGCLFLLALVDMLIYQTLGSVTVCYLCQSVYRNLPRNREHQIFYLGSEEKYKRLRGEWVKTLLEKT